MRIYPKGCRYYVVADGSVSPVNKRVSRCNIDDLGPGGGQGRDRVCVVVQPRGKKKWWLFRRHWNESARFITTGSDPDPLVMRALLGDE